MSTSRRYFRRTFSTTCLAHDHYKTLGLTPQATKAQIKSHYYQLSKKHHPDVCPDHTSHDIFTAVSEAYTVLSNDRERRAYDRTLQAERADRPGAAYSPHAPQSRGPRATHAWETTHRTRPAYGTGRPVHPRRRREEWPTGKGPPPPAMGGTSWGERRAEAAEQEQERVRGVSGARRAVQLVVLLGLSFAMVRAAQ